MTFLWLVFSTYQEDVLHTCSSQVKDKVRYLNYFQKLVQQFYRKAQIYATGLWTGICRVPATVDPMVVGGLLGVGLKRKCH